MPSSTFHQGITDAVKARTPGPGYVSTQHPGTVLVTFAAHQVDPGVILYDLIGPDDARRIANTALAGLTVAAFTKIVPHVTQLAVAAGRIDAARLLNHLGIAGNISLLARGAI